MVGGAPAQVHGLSMELQDHIPQTSMTIAREEAVTAANYLPLPLVLVRGDGEWLWDDRGNRYLDMMSAYSAVSHGHCHPRLLRVLNEQARTLAVASRAYHTDRLTPFLEKLTAMTGLDRALPMNTGAEAVETAIKAARRWGYTVKGIPEGEAEIIVAQGNFHGRTTTIVGFSSDEDYKTGFGPFTPGFVEVPFGDAGALAAAITGNTCAVLIEPIQGEAGIVVPPRGYLKRMRDLCDTHNVLMILDEIQSGLGRTGATFAYEHEGVRPDGLILGKALGGGLLPVSAFVARGDVMDVFTPGSHGSTFGGNPLAAAVGLEALRVLEDEKLAERSARLGDVMMRAIRAMNSPLIADVRGRGLWIGIEIDPRLATAREVCERLMENGVLSKETHETVVRFAPPLTIAEDALAWGIEQFRLTLRGLEAERFGAEETQATA
jgi:ornithine--oxo-acid transaminase